MSEDRFTLFGFESPEQVRRRIGRDAVAQGMAAANVPRGRGNVALAASLGPMLGNIFDVGGEQKLAKSRSEAQQNAFDRSKGKPGEYYRFLAENLNAVGDQQGALMALEQYRGVSAQTAAAQFEREKLEATKTKNEQMYKAKLDALESKMKVAELKADIKRQENEIKRMATESDVGVNDQKVKNMQAEIEDNRTKLEQAAERLRQADDKLEIVRGKLAVNKYDAKTRRMKLKSDEKIATLKNKGLKGKAAQKMFKDAMSGYERTAQKKELFDFAKSLVEDDPELGAFFSDVDPEQMAVLIRGSLMQKINNARQSFNTDFDYNQAVINSVIDVTEQFTTMGENSVGIDRAKPKGLTPSESTPKLTDEQLMNQILEGQ